MARIPEFQQRQLARSAQFSSVTPSTISSAGAGFRAVAEVADAISGQVSKFAQEKLATQSAEFNSGLEVQAQEIFTGLTQDEEVRNDPTLLRSRLDEAFQGLQNSPEFQDQPGLVQNNAISRLQSLQSQFGRQAVQFEARQTLQNNVDNLDATQNNYEQLAGNSDKSIDDILQAYTKDIIPFAQATGSAAKAEEIQRAGSASIITERVNRLIEQQDFRAAEELLASDDEGGLGDFLDVKERVRLRDSISRTEKSLRKESEKEQLRLTAINAVTDAFDSGTPIDAKNRENQKVLDEFYKESGVNDSIVSGQVEGANQLANIAVKTGYIPELAESTLRAQLFTGSPEQKGFAADVISRLQEVAPRSLDAFSKDELTQANLAISYIRSGISPSTAFEFADKQTDMTNEKILRVRKGSLDDVAKDVVTDSNIQDALDPGFFTFEPELPDAPLARDSIIADYRNIFEGFYLSTGNKEVSKKLTDREFKRFYGPTEVTGPRRVMKYPPENFYSVPGLDNDWMEEQLGMELNELTGQEVDLDDVVILADSITAREAQPNGRPSYQIFIKGELGDFQEVRSPNGELLRFRFDPTEAIEGQRRKLEKEQQDAFESAKRVRERRLLEQSIFTPDELAEQTVLRSRGLIP